MEPPALATVDEDALRELIDTLPAAVAWWSADRRLVYANRLHQEWFRTPPHLQLGGAMGEVLGEALHHCLRPALEAVERGEPQRVQGERQTPEGVRQHIVRMVPRLDRQGQPDGQVVLVVDKSPDSELELANARVAALITHSPDAISSADLEGRVTTWNPGAQRLLGWQAEEIIGLPFMRLVPPELKDESQGIRERVLRGEQVPPFDTVRLHKDGTRVPMSVSIFPVHAAEGKVLRVSAIMRDITALKAAESALRASEENFRLLTEASPVGVFRTDAAGSCTYTNPALRAISGRSAADSLGDAWVLAIHPEDRERVAGEWRGVAARGHSHETRYRIQRPNGERRHVHVYVAPVHAAEARLDGFVGAVHDVTERVATAQALEASRRRLRQLYEATPAMLHSCDDQGRLLAVSDTWLAKLGRHREEVIGLPQQSFFAEGSRESFERSTWPELLREGRVDDVPVQLRRPDASTLDAVYAATVEPADTQEPDAARRVLVLMEDVTESLRRKAELQRECRLRAEVERRADELTELLGERGRMLDVLAHEVRQPLNNASAALEAAQAAKAETGPGDDDMRSALARAAQVLTEVRSGIDNTLASAALLVSDEPLATDDCEVDLLVTLALGDLDAVARERVELVRESATRTAAMDVGLMRLALRNLLVNALRYAQGPVALVLSDSDDPLGLVIEVRDRGPGFDADLVPRLFERGARGRRPSSGSGLGLYIVRRVLERHGGSVALTHNQPGDVRMRLLLPPAADEA